MTAHEFRVSLVIWLVLAGLLSLTPLYWWAAALIAAAIAYGGFLVISSDWSGSDWGW